MCTESRKLLENWDDRPLASLIEHIVETHHVFCRREVTRINSLFKEAIDMHGKGHPELRQIQTLFFKMSRDLSMHLLKEEQTLFPYIARVEEAIMRKDSVSWPPFGSVENPIRMMILEHAQADKEIEGIRKLSKEYTPPADAREGCTELYSALAAFDQDMQRHVYFEDQNLFPRAVAMEEKACTIQTAAEG
jgi:regulator of cell morphogenesis and NO signaling